MYRHWISFLAACAVVTLGACSGESATLTKTSTTRATNSSTTTTSAENGACSRSDQPTTAVYRVVAGVPKNLTSLDVHAPTDACNSPVVMWVHGGGYVRGDKTNQVDDKIRLFNEKGWTFVSVNYRLSSPLRSARRRPAAVNKARDATFPEHYDDVAASIAWVKANIAKYGGNPQRIAILGHSAGADIVSNVVVDPRHLATYSLTASAVVCAGALDTEGFDKVTAGAQDPDGEKAQWKVALGNNPNYLTETSATRNVRAGAGIPPMVVAVRGSDQRQQIERAFVAALTAAKVPTTTIDARALTHAQVNARIGADGDTVMTPPLVTFLTGCFKK